MFYNDLYYYNNFNEIIKNLRTVRSEMRLDDPIGHYSFRNAIISLGFDLIVNGLLYFSNISCLLHETRCGRNDWRDQYVELDPRGVNPTIPSEHLVGAPTKITLCYVAGQITEFFENSLVNLTPCYTLDDNNEILKHTWEELKGLSIALKCSPRHRVRVYKYTMVEKNTEITRQHIVVYSAKAFNDDDLLLKRKVYAAIPYMLGLDNDHALTKVLRALENKSCDEWLEDVDTYLNSLDKYTNYVRHRLIQRFKTLNNMHSNALKARKADIDDNISRILQDYRENLKVQHDILNEIAGMSDACLTEDDIKMLIDKGIIQDLTVDTSSNTTIDFSISSPVLSYEKAAAEKYYSTISDIDRVYKTLFKHVFLDEDCVLYFTDRVRINFSNYTYEARSRIIADPPGQVLFRNPHHKHYNCWGGYATAITNLISEFNFMQLFMQIKAGVGSLNMTDYTVLRRFRNDVESMYDSTRQPRVIAFKSNPKTLYTLKEAYDVWKTIDTVEQTD